MLFLLIAELDNFKAIIINTDRKMNTTQYDIFHSEVLYRSILRRTYNNRTICFNGNTTDTEQDCLRTARRTDICLQRGIFTVKQHICRNRIPEIR